MLRWIALSARSIRSPVRLPPVLRRGHATEPVSAATLQFGQPVHETHPHLLAPGELTPGISALEYAQRRSRLAARLPEGGLAVVAAAELKYRSGAVHYPFHQDANFFYLTGFNEPGALAVIGKSEQANDHTFHVLVRPKDREAELWEGARSGLEAATDVFNADETGDINRLAELLPPLLASAKAIYADLPSPATSASDAAAAHSPGAFFARLFRPFEQAGPQHSGLVGALDGRDVRPLSELVHPLRAHKSQAEIALMRGIGRATGRAFQRTMRRKWTRERELMAYLEGEFVRGWCDGPAYVPVVAGGRHALSIHYTRNDDLLRDGELVLVDAGGEHGHYVADVTRTFPVGPRFSDAQRDLYAAVLAVQRSCVALCREDAGHSLDKLHAIAERQLAIHLADLGFDLPGQAIRTLFPHHLGHYIGLDIHDTPGFSRREPLRAGQCVTVEPSVHVPDDERWPAHFRGLSVQVEDSVAVGAEHPLVLSAEAPKEVVDIEELRAEMIEMEEVERL